MKMIDHNHFICHLILGTFTEYPDFTDEIGRGHLASSEVSCPDG